MAIDKDKLIAWIEAHAGMRRVPLVGAIYAGLADRIRRGDFDMKENI